MRLFTVVKEQSACIVERFGKYHKTLSSGLHFMVPIMDNISYTMQLKEETISIDNQQAITKDNVSVLIGGTIFFRIEDPYKAAYNVEQPLEAVKLLALTVLRSEIGKMRLDKLFQERAELNKSVNLAVNNAAGVWGIKCMRYEILNIDPPIEIKMSMQYEAEAERLKRRDVVVSEGKQQSEINLAEGRKTSLIKRAEGDAESMKLISQSESIALQKIGEQFLKLKQEHPSSINYILLQNYLKAYERTLRKSNLIVTPEGAKSAGGSGSSDLITVAAMLALKQQGSSYPQPNDNFQQLRTPNQLNGSQTSQQTQQTIPTDYPELLSKMKFYEDPILYSSDDETKRGTSNNNNSSASQDSTQSSVNLSDSPQSRDRPIKLRA